MEKLVISSSVLVAAIKLIKASARSGGCEISRNVLLLTAQWLIRSLIISWEIMSGGYFLRYVTVCLRPRRGKDKD